MSASGQKQTCAVQKGMSALPPIATSNLTTLENYKNFAQGATLESIKILRGWSIFFPSAQFWPRPPTEGAQRASAILNRPPALAAMVPLANQPSNHAGKFADQATDGPSLSLS